MRKDERTLADYNIIDAACRELRRCDDNNSYELTVNPISVLREKDPEINNKIQTRYKELRSDGWSNQAIDSMLDGYEQDIFGSGAYIRDMECWPDGNYQDPEAGLSIFR